MSLGTSRTRVTDLEPGRGVSQKIPGTGVRWWRLQVGTQ